MYSQRSIFRCLHERKLSSCNCMILEDLTGIQERAAATGSSVRRGQCGKQTVMHLLMKLCGYDHLKSFGLHVSLRLPPFRM